MEEQEKVAGEPEADVEVEVEEETAMMAAYAPEPEPPDQKPEEKPDEQKAVDGTPPDGEVKSSPDPKPEEKPDDLAELKAKLEGVESLKDSLKQLGDKVFGKVGNLEQQIRTLQTAQEAAGKLSPKARDRLSEEYPEFAKLLFGDEEQIAEKIDTNVSEAQPDQTTRKPEETPEKIIERRLLKRDHPNWEKDVGSPEFEEWFSAQPVEAQQNFTNSWDADYISEKLTEFKDWNKTRQTPPPADNKPDETLKRDRLLANINPRGGTRIRGSDLDDEEQAMVRGFNS